MRASARSFPLAALVALSSAPAIAGSPIYLPPAPTGPGGEDSIETSSGTRCRQSINSNGAYFDAGMAGSAAKPLDPSARTLVAESRDREAFAYMRVTVPIGTRPKRIDCSSIYEIEIQRLRREVELLKMAAE